MVSEPSAPKPSREEDPSLADFVVGMTRSMLRTGYYSRKHPEGQKSLLGLYASFAELMGDRGREFSFQLSFARDDADVADVALYDGTRGIRSMREVLSGVAADAFVPKLVDYFNRHGLLSFTLNRDITQPDFETFVERMTRPPVAGEKQPAEALSQDLAAAGVRGVSVVFDEDRIKGLRGSVPWRAELALARLRKDVRMIPLLANATDLEVIQIKLRLMEDILRGLHEAALILTIAVHLSEALLGHEDIMGRDEAEHRLVAAVHSSSIAAFAQAASAPLLPGTTKEEPEKFRACRERIIPEIVKRLIAAPDAKAAHALVLLYERKYIDVAALPQSAQRLVRGHALAEMAGSDPTKLAEALIRADGRDPYPALIEDLEVTTSALVDVGAFETAEAMARTLWQCAKGQLPSPPGGAELAAKALERIGTKDAVERLAAAVHGAGTADAPPARIIRLFEPASLLKSLKAVLDQTQDRVLRHFAVEEMIAHVEDTPGVLVELLAAPKTEWHVLKCLLIVARRSRDELVFSAVAKLFEHEHPLVRAEALNAMAVLAPERAMRSVELAFEDRDPELRRAAALAIAASARPSDVAVRRLLGVLANDREVEGVRLQAAASLGTLAARNPPVRQRSDIVDAIRMVITEKHGSRMQRFKRFAHSRLPPPPHLLAGACAALGVVGAAEDRPLLEACLEDDSPDVRESAQLAITRLRTSSSPASPR